MPKTKVLQKARIGKWQRKKNRVTVIAFVDMEKALDESLEVSVSSTMFTLAKMALTTRNVAGWCIVAFLAFIFNA